MIWFTAFELVAGLVAGWWAVGNHQRRQYDRNHTASPPPTVHTTPAPAPAPILYHQPPARRRPQQTGLVRAAAPAPAVYRPPSSRSCRCEICVAKKKEATRLRGTKIVSWGGDVVMVTPPSLPQDQEWHDWGDDDLVGTW